uniref:endogenous retrovirus group PABLB member 1 Env polyprotein-like n=1 Tax=Pristiophorus japonicus TaxID=55135 RepID=UPI00398F07D9
MVEWLTVQNRTNLTQGPETKEQTEWRSAGYKLTAFQGWYQPVNNHQPPFLSITPRIENPEGIICLVSNKTKGPEMGRSKCSQMTKWQATTNPTDGRKIATVGWTMVHNKAPGEGWEGETSRVGMARKDQELTSYNCTYFICGHKAYPWLPANWTGSCYLGYVVPFIRSIKTLRDAYGSHRFKRDLTWLNGIFKVMVPPYGIVSTEWQLRELANLVESVANATSQAFEGVNDEMVAIRTVALQNRMALDYLLAKEGGTCALIGEECCTYIPDKSEEIGSLAEYIRKKVIEYKQTVGQDGITLWGWASGWLGSLGKSVVQGLIIFLLIVFALYLLFVVIKCCCAKVGETMLPIETTARVMVAPTAEGSCVEMEMERLYKIRMD